MPLPKGIYANPAVRLAWIEDRQSKVDAFDRLVAKGQSPRKAALTLRLSVGGVRAMRDSVESMAGQSTGRTKGERIDLGLALLSLANPPGPDRQTLTSRDIAAWCDCTHAGIQSIERRALRKLHGRLNAILREQVVTGDFGEMDALTRALHPLAAAA